MVETVYVYGTLRPGDTDPILIPGDLYELGWFPGIKLNPHGLNQVVCEKIEVADLGPVDRYEGFDPTCHAHSLYIRREITPQGHPTGWIYEYNKEVNPVTKVQSGDWLDWRKEARGSHFKYGNQD